MDDDIYDSDFDSDFEDLVNSGKDIQVIYLDSVEQCWESQQELRKLSGSDHNSNIAQYIITKPTNI